ncbi:related to DEG1-pseudouridine synthase [Serendipita indica DSM 11827]|uniref:Related to DEG1-pseudouridine synthase n=1 Tax=Serendipita indica (strain DSM 11827) TaxID=1109443 RepID=G4TDU7_SERID|nr:related to DEG1-pseudouridine synthase [Serendipita indica DSM 11827]
MADYEAWTREQLVERILQLESKKKPTAQTENGPTSHPNNPRLFNFQAYAQRKIALKFCYHGWDYNGLAYQVTPTPLPTVEGVLFDALCKARLIDREAGFEGCDWSRCGRTDRGVSSAGQVVALRMRCSLRPVETVQPFEEAEVTPPTQPSTKSEPPELEVKYIQVLNRILPPSIRVLAWAPVDDTFSARFNCRYRHYKYFFQPLNPPASPLNIDKMRNAASLLVGEHDFRNFCKLDGSKQIERYDRRVVSATISRLTSPTIQGEKPMYVFDLVGSAFLWHQVRHIMGVLFLVGQGLEDASIVNALLNTDSSRPSFDPSLPLLECRPLYDMAEGLPLVLWECGFDQKDIRWRTDEWDGDGEVPALTGTSSVHLLETMESSTEATDIKGMMLKHFQQVASQYHRHPDVGADSVVRIQAGVEGFGM